MTSQTMGAAPGWYPDGHGAIRYFDGSAWTEHTQVEPASTPAPATQVQETVPVQEAADRPFYQEGWFLVDVAFLALIAVIIIVASIT